MQVKFNFDNFIFYGVCLPQLGSVPARTPSSLAVVIGLSNNDVISLRSLRCVRCGGWEPRLRHYLRGWAEEARFARLFLGWIIEKNCEWILM